MGIIKSDRYKYESKNIFFKRSQLRGFLTFLHIDKPLGDGLQEENPVPLYWRQLAYCTSSGIT